jgi:GNAT superfamily N-acetyltransferase
MELFSLRLARPDELQELILIDDEASELYARAGLRIELSKDHAFTVAESARWADAIASGLAYVAVDAQDHPVGFAAVRLVDGNPYLDQLAVRPYAMRRGIGTALLRQAISWSGGRALWLTTYSHLAWNRPYYQRHGFAPVPDDTCGIELLAILEEQRAALPDPGKRIAMARFHSTSQATDRQPIQCQRCLNSDSCACETPLTA